MTDQKKPRRQRRTAGGATERINVRVTPETKADLVERAAVAGLSLPHLLVTAALKLEFGTWSRVVHDEMDLIRRLLSRVAGTLNQLAARLNSTGTDPSPAELSAALTLLIRALERLERVLDEAGVR